MEKKWILPEVKAEIEAMKRYQRQKEQEKKDKELFRETLSPRYLLIDAALWDRDVNDIFSGNVAYRSLFRGATGKELWSVAPYLVDAGSNEDFIRRIKDKNQVDRRITRLHSDLDIDALRKHLRHFLRVKTEDGRYLYFRFYDPYVVNTVFPNLTKEQLGEFLGPLEYIITEDVRINERRIYYLSLDKELRIKYQTINHVDNQ
jgi:hypothetical protein